jgi:2-polyprenyl-6-methoxyphenol hydroxylase-like FAD-dependent oxidoreductase
MYDVIVVGARCAGSPTAMLLAQLGHAVLLVDRSSFPSDTVSAHLVTVPGVVRLDRWGLLENVAASGSPPIERLTFSADGVSFSGAVPALDGVARMHSVRRTVLDTLLVDAAVEAGAELREGFVVRELLFDGDRVVGVRGRDAGGSEVVEQARLTVGADGLHSRVAAAVEARHYDDHPSLTSSCYSYWSGARLDGGEIHVAGDRVVTAYPTNDDLVCVSVTWPAAEAERFRTELEGNFLATVDLMPGLADRIRAGTRVRPFVGTADLPNLFRESHGPGWALVGDAGHHKDPLLGQGIADAFRDAELLAEAVDAGLSGLEPLEAALAGYEQRRNTAAKPAYELTSAVARLDGPRTELARLAREAEESPAGVEHLLGVFAGVLPVALVAGQ